MTENRTWEISQGDAADIPAGITHNRTNEDYNNQCRQALTDSEPGPIREGY